MKSKPKGSYWLVKQEPETYSWSDFLSDGGTDWTGVRNYQARNNLREMKTGERVLFYHSGKDKAVVGLAEVVKSAYPDPTADDEQWVAVDLKPIKALRNPVPLAAIRYDKRLSQFSWLLAKAKAEKKAAKRIIGKSGDKLGGLKCLSRSTIRWWSFPIWTVQLNFIVTNWEYL